MSSESIGRVNGLSTARFVAALSIVVTVGAVLRFSGLTSRPLWLDEVCTWYCVQNWDDWPADGPDRDREVTHRAYYSLLRGWAKLAGHDAWGLRSFSALSGVLAVAAIGLLGSRMGGRALGLTAAALAAVHPLHIHYSQEARAYALWTLEITLLLGVLHEAATAKRNLVWATYVVLAFLAWKTHDYTIFFLPAALAGLWITHDRKRFFRGWLLAHAVLAVFLAPAVWSFVQSQVTGGSKSWIREVWEKYPPILAIPRSLWAMLPSGAYPEYLPALSAATDPARSPLGWSVASVARWGSAVLVAAVVSAILVRRRSAANKLLLFLGAGVAVFCGTAWLFSLAVYPAYVVGRYDLAAWPATVLFISALICHVCQDGRKAVRSLTVAALLVALSVLTVFGTRAVAAGTDLRERARRLADHVPSDDLVVSVALYKWFMLHEWDRLGFRPAVISFPPAHDRQLGWEDAQTELKKPAVLESAVTTVVETVDRALAGGRRVWVVAQGQPSGPRWEVDRQFYAALRSRGIDITPIDEWAGLAKLTRVP